jgi:hypothetical protein
MPSQQWAMPEPLHSAQVSSTALPSPETCTTPPARLARSRDRLRFVTIRRPGRGMPRIAWICFHVGLAGAYPGIVPSQQNANRIGTEKHTAHFSSTKRWYVFNERSIHAEPVRRMVSLSRSS